MRRLLVAALFVSGGCIDFREVVGPESASALATLHVILRHYDDASAPDGPGGRGVSVTAYLEPGTDAKGWPRRVVDEVLFISRVGMEPQRTYPDGTREYTGWIPLRGELPDGGLLRVSAPRVAGMEPPEVVFHAFPTRLGAASLELEPGADLRLPFAYSPPPWAAPAEELWTLSIEAGTAWWGDFGTGFPSSPLVVRAEGLPKSRDSRLRVRLLLERTTSAGRGGSDGYRVEVRSAAELGWTVRRAEIVAPG